MHGHQASASESYPTSWCCALSTCTLMTPSDSMTSKNADVVATLIVSLNRLLSAWVGYVFISMQIEYIRSIWWFMYDPTALGADTAAIVIAVLTFVVLPLALEIRRVFWFILRHVSIIPIIVSCLLAVNYPRAIPARVRNVFLALSFLLISAHDVAVCHRRNSSVYKQNAQVSRLSSLVALWFIIFGTQGVNPMLDYTSMNIIGWIVSLAASVYAWRYDRISVESEDQKAIFPRATLKTHQQYHEIREYEENSRLMNAVQKFRRLSTLYGGITWGATLFITLWIFGSPFTAPQYSGVQLAYGLVVIAVFMVGFVAAAYVKSDSFLVRVIVCAILILGVGLYAHSNTGGGALTGGVIIAFVLPRLWFMTFSQLAWQRHPGLTLCLGGILFFLALFITIVMVWGGDQGLPLGPELQGKREAALWMVTVPLVLTQLISNTDTGEDASFEPPAEDDDVEVGNDHTNSINLIPVESPPHALNQPLVVLRALGIVLLVIGIPCIIAYSVSSGFLRPDLSTIPNNQFIATSYNVQSGYTLQGLTNFVDVRHVFRELKSQVICISEADTSSWVFGSRSQILYYARSLGYDYSTGPPSWIQHEGVAIISAFPILESSYEILPSPKECDVCPVVDRVLLRAVMRPCGEDGPQLTAFCSHFQYAPDEINQEQGVYTAAKIQEIDGPVLVMGDLNFEPTSPGFQALNNTRLRSSIPPNDDGSYPTTSQVGNGTHIDYILYDGGTAPMELLSSEVVQERDTSDHFPVNARFRCSSVEAE